MENTKIAESGVVGVEIRLTVQEMVVLADLKRGLEYALEHQNPRIQATLYKGLAKDLRTILHKMIKEAKCIEEPYEELFNEE